jgi:tetratricopeptide (TPR) repeat protein
MKRQTRTTLVASACLIVSLAASILVLRNIERMRPQGAIADVLYVNSPKVVKRMSLGYDGLMACIYWTRTVQYFGHRHHDEANTYNQLGPLLEITTALDPHLSTAYQFGATFLAPAPPNGAGEPGRAIKLMNYGIEHNPNDWHFYQNLGFVYYTELHDYAKAADAFARGASLPDSHPSMRILAAAMAEHAGELDTAKMLWIATYDSSHDKEIRNNAAEHLRGLKVEEDVSQLEAAVTNFGIRIGRLPVSMIELARAAGIPGIPVDPDGNPYQLTPEGRILVQHPENFPFISKGIPPGYEFKGKPKFHVEQ